MDAQALRSAGAPPTAGDAPQAPHADPLREDHIDAAPGGGTLVVGTWQEPDNLNAYFTWTASGVWFGMLAVESALRPDGRGGFVPVLIERVPTVENGDVSADGLRIVYRLRRGLRWSDGAPLTSADFRFTWKALSDPVNEVISREAFGLVKDVETPDPYTAVLHLDRPYAPYPMFYMAVFPEHLFGDQTDLNGSSFNYTPIGTGPFYVERWDRGREILYKRNPFYRGPGPNFDELRLRIFPSQDAVAEALAEGEADLAVGLGPRHAEELGRRAELSLLVRHSTITERIVYNLRDPVLRDPRVREALDLAIDRDRLVTEVSGGMLEPATSELDGSDWFETFAIRRPDPSGSAELLERAGWRLGPDGRRRKDREVLSLRLVAPAGDELRDRTISSATEMLAEVGIELDVELYPTSRYFAAASGEGPLVLGDFQLALVGSGMFGDPEPNYKEAYHSGLVPTAGNGYAGGNFGSYSNTRVDGWLDEAGEVLDRAARRRLYAKVERTLHAECPASYLYKRPTIDACRGELRGLSYLPYPSVWCLTWSASEWAWEQDSGRPC